MAVRVIQATNPSFGEGTYHRPATLRVAAYCRVSTDSDEQKSSYDAQRRHYIAYIDKHADWELAGIFADEGISGTQARRRPEFLRMIDDCEHHRIDLVITKSISRFARNTLDCLNYIRRLKELGIPVIFEKESINTMEASGEVLITILASLAQQESASISQNVKMGIRYVMQEGRGRVNYTRFLGYTCGPTKGSLVIVPHEADVIRLIFRRYLEGFSPALIAAQMQEGGILTPAGGTRWHASTIASILRNEKYCGDLLLQKYFTQDYLTHKVVRNSGQLPQYFVEDHHEPIVPKEVFLRVQAERTRRSQLRNTPSNLRFGSREALRGRLICGLCGRTLKRCAGADGTLVEWRCCVRSHVVQPGTSWVPDDCNLRGVREAAAQRAVFAAVNELPGMRDRLRLEFEALQDSPDAQTDHEMQLRMLLELLDQMQPAAAPAPSQEPLSPACYDAEDFYARTRYRVPEGLLDASGRLVRFDDALLVRYLRRAVIYPDHIDVEFKAGVTRTH